MATRDLYAALGIPKSASDADVKKAYRRLARKYHPDVNPGDATAKKKFQEIASAYEILKDAKRRKHYDLTGDTGEPPEPGAWPPGGGVPRGAARSAGSPFGGGPGGGGPGGGFRWTGDFGDLFSELFSGGAPGVGPRGVAEDDDDAAAQLTIPFRDAVLGGAVSFRARLPRRCARCGGSGRTGGSPCPVCRGLGEVVSNEKITIRIPAGVSTGSKVRVAGKGRTEEGDLYVALTVEPHPYFGREGDDILTEVPVTVPEAYAGAEIEIPTIHGPVRAKIPPGTAAGQRFRIKGFGVRSGRGADGDHYYRVTVATPERVTDEGRKIAEKFAALYERNPRANLPSGL